MRTQIHILTVNLTLCFSFLLAACSQPTPSKLAETLPIAKASASPRPPDSPQITVDKIKLNQDSSDPYAIVALRLEPAYLELRTLEVAKIKVVAQLANRQIVEVINQSKLNWQIPDPRLLSHLNGTLKALQTGETFVKVQIGQYQAELKVKILTSGSGSGSGSISPPQLKLGRTDYPLAVGESVYLDAKLILPDGSESKDLIYSVDRSDLFELDSTSGRLRRLREGTATVTVQARLNGNVLQTIAIGDKKAESGSGGGGGGGGGSSQTSSTPSPSASVSPSPSVSATPTPILSPTPTSEPTVTPTPELLADGIACGTVSECTTTCSSGISYQSGLNPRVCGVEPTPTPTPTVSPSSTPAPNPSAFSLSDLTGKIVFLSTKTGNSELFIMKADGTELKQLTQTAGGEEIPVWSPDKTKIAYSRLETSGGRKLFIMELENGNLTQLSFPGLTSYALPEWSPDGNFIAFQGQQNGDSKIFTINIQNNTITLLTPDSSNNFSPAWSPDGNEIAFASNRGGGGSQIWIMKADGSQQFSLNSNSKGTMPKWSPDGKTIIYNNSGSLYKIDRATGQISYMKSKCVDARYSSDGKQIIYASSIDLSIDLYIMNADTSYSVRLTQNEYIDRGGDWR